MNTEKSIGGRNWNVFLYTLKQLPDFADKLSLNDYAYQGAKLKINDTDFEIECKNDKYLVYEKNALQTEYLIQQVNGIDIEDRVDKGKQIINTLLNSIGE